MGDFESVGCSCTELLGRCFKAGEGKCAEVRKVIDAQLGGADVAIALDGIVASNCCVLGHDEPAGLGRTRKSSGRRGLVLSGMCSCLVWSGRAEAAQDGGTGMACLRTSGRHN